MRPRSECVFRCISPSSFATVETVEAVKMNAAKSVKLLSGFLSSFAPTHVQVLVLLTMFSRNPSVKSDACGSLRYLQAVGQGVQKEP